MGRKSKSDAALAGKPLKRSEELVGKGFISCNKLDTDLTGMEGAMTAVGACFFGIALFRFRKAVTQSQG